MDPMKRFTITTLGCKVNQCESAAIETLLQEAGHVKSDGGGTELVIVNTCTVTGKAAMQSRQAIRQAIRSHPGAQVVVTGCYAQTAPEEIRSIPEVDLLVGHGDKLNLVTILDAPPDAGSPRQVHQPVEGLRTFSALPSVAPESRTRAFLKIQDGCNAFCTYCIVPHARGRSRSMPMSDALKHLRKLAGEGFKEVVLSGIHLGAYGKDLDPSKRLTDLLAAASRQGLVPRLRISSIEPTEIDADLIDLMKTPASVVCPHFHIPLQSGDNTILRRMGRTYTRERFADLIHRLRGAFPQAAIGVDVLSGFPGETAAAYQQTHDLIRDLPVTYLHVFPFSPRKGTPAAAYDHQVPQHIVKARCKTLRRLGEAKKRQFARANIGRTVKVLVESKDDALAGYPKGTSENYLTVGIPGAAAEENTVVPVCVGEVKADGSVLGHIVKK
jgi:threonylcarbamoyladenosine tRNA methylthiotransferase MtaB